MIADLNASVLLGIIIRQPNALATAEHGRKLKLPEVDFCAPAHCILKQHYILSAELGRNLGFFPYFGIFIGQREDESCDNFGRFTKAVRLSS